MPTIQNPYQAQPRDYDSNGEAPGPMSHLYPHVGAYAVPDASETNDPEYTTAYATELNPNYGSGTTPDAIRTGRAEPPLNDPNNREYNAIRNSEFHRRHSVEEVTQDWSVRQQKVAPGQNPMWEQERMPIRQTATKAPMPYMFTRPWHIPRHVQDAVGEDAMIHMSLADHRRAYEIYGMAPQGGLGVNSHRLDPEPWDSELFYPAQPDNSESFTGAVGGNRSYRL